MHTSPIAALLSNMALELGQANAANTGMRRTAWMDQVGIPKARQDEYYLNPTPGNSGLVGCNPDTIKKMGEEALDRETLHKELCIPAQAAARGRGAGNTPRGGLAGIYSKRGLGRGAGKGRGNT